MKSIRLRLLAWLLAAVGAAAAIQGIVAYRAALAEADQLFDYHIHQLALSLRDHAPGADSAQPGADPYEEQYDFVVQIWSSDGERIYLSHPHVNLPDHARLGFSRVRTGDWDWRVYATQLRGRTIEVAQPMAVRRELAAAFALRSVAPLAPVAALLALAVWIAVGAILRPLETVAEAVRRRGTSEFAPFGETGLPSEVAPLVRALNGLLGRLQSAIDTQRSFVADAAHELRSPLTALKLQLQLLERAQDEPGRRAAVARLGAGIERAAHLVEQLLTLARSEPNAAPLRLQTIALDEVVRQAVADVAPLAYERGVDIGLAARAAEVDGDGEALRILVRNLLDNAVRYTPRGGRVEVSIRRGDAQTVLTVADNGPGIAPQDRERVFDRFYRADSAPGGSGLGLAIVKTIAERHGVRVVLGNAPGGGLLVRVELPLRARRS